MGLSSRATSTACEQGPAGQPANQSTQKLRKQGWRKDGAIEKLRKHSQTATEPASQPQEYGFELRGPQAEHVNKGPENGFEL